MISGSFKILKNNEEIANIDNLILDPGLGIFSTNEQRNRCSLGDGKTQPQVTDFDLENQLLVSTNITDDFFWYDESPFSVTHSFVYQFTVPVDGIRFTEVGVGQTGNLLSRALVKDNNGIETSININGDESLRVVHSITFTPDINDYVFIATVGGVNHTITVRPCNIGSQTTWRSVCGDTWVTSATFYETLTLGSITAEGVGSGEQQSLTYPTADSVTSPDGSGVRYAVVSDIDQTAFTNGIGGLIFETGGSNITGTNSDGLNGKYQVTISPPIMKTVDDKLTINLDLGL